MIVKFFKSVFSTFIGRRLWLKIKKKYDVENGKYVLLMPESDRELNEVALKHIDDLLKYRKGKSVLILTTDSWVLENAKKYSNNIVDVAKITDKQADFYCFYCFSERFLIVSLDRPCGNSLFKAVGVNEIVKEDLICLGIFLMRNWERAEEYHG
jgi:hypothetical protein